MTLSHFCGEGRGNAESTIACSPDMPRCGIIRGFCPRRINKKATGVAFLWRKARDSNPRILSHQRFSRPPLSTAQPAFRACKLYHKKRLICKPYRKIKEENQKLPYGTKVVCPYAYSAGRETPCNLIPQAWAAARKSVRFLSASAFLRAYTY